MTEPRNYLTYELSFSSEWNPPVNNANENNNNNNNNNNQAGHIHLLYTLYFNLKTLNW